MAMVNGQTINHSHQPLAIDAYRALTSNNVPAPPPSAAPMSAPFFPPKIAPRPAPAAVVPPITIAVFFQSRPDVRSTRLGAVCVTRDVVTRRGAGAGYVSNVTGRTSL